MVALWWLDEVVQSFASTFFRPGKETQTRGAYDLREEDPPLRGPLVKRRTPVSVFRGYPCN